MAKKGQSLVEFLIIIGLIGVASILVLTLLGNNINQMFSLSSIKFGDFKPFGDPIAATAKNIVNNPQTSNPVKNVNIVNPVVSPSSATPSSSVNPTNQTTVPANNVISQNQYGSITQDANGSVTITLANGKTISNLDSNFINNLNATVTQTTGSSGEEFFLQTLNKMVADYLITNPTAKSVPLDIGFGGGDWNVTSQPSMKGSGATTMYKIQIDNKITIVYKEETNPTFVAKAPSLVTVFPGTISNNSFNVSSAYWYDTKTEQKYVDNNFATSYTGSVSGNSIKGNWTNSKNADANGQMNFAIYNNFNLKGK